QPVGPAPAKPPAPPTGPVRPAQPPPGLAEPRQPARHPPGIEVPQKPDDDGGHEQQDYQQRQRNHLVHRVETLGPEAWHHGTTAARSTGRPSRNARPMAISSASVRIRVSK